MKSKPNNRKEKDTDQDEAGTAGTEANIEASFVVAGIDASAGGLDAITHFLKSLSENPGMAYVIFPHLSPTHRSDLPEILQRTTRMPVHEVKSNMAVEPDNVYVIPPNAAISISDGILKVSAGNEELQHRNDDLKEAKDFASAIVDTIREPLIVLNAQLRVRSANRSFYQLFGVHPDEVERLYFYEIMNGKWDMPKLRKQISDLVTENKNLQNFEVRQTFAGAGEKVILVNGMRIEQENIRHNEILLVFEDITQRKRVEKALRHSYKIRDSIINSISDVFMAVDNKWNITYFNKKAEEVIQPKVSDVLGKNIWKVFPDYLHTELETRALEAMKTQAVQEFDFYEPTKKRWFYLRMYPALEGLSIYGSDITEQKQSQQYIEESRQRYQTFVSQSTEGIWRYELGKPVSTSLSPTEQLDLLYQYAYLEECNDTMARMYGYTSAAKIIGTKLETLLPRTPVNEAYLTSFIQAGYKITEAESEELDTEGKTKYFLNNLIGIVEDGFVKRAWGTQRDITARKETEVKLRESEEKFRVLIQHSSDIIMIYSVDGLIKYQSPSVKQVLGYDATERVGRHIDDDPLIHPDDANEQRRMINHAMTGENNTPRFEFRLRHADGSYRTVEAACTNMLHNSTINGIVANYRDITERKRLEEQKEQFIGIASHELKTPVTSIKGYTQILHESFVENNDAVSAEMVMKMDLQIDRLTNLIKDLLDITRISGGQMHFKEEEFFFNELVNEIVEEMQHTTKRHKIILQLAEDVQVCADRERTGQVLVNFLANAIKYSPDSADIIVSTSRTADHITVSVQDFGIGMSEEMQDKIFDRFFRVNDAIAATYPGLGLGLYIAAEIIKKQRGKIWVKSKKAEGSTFSFSLPIQC